MLFGRILQAPQTGTLLIESAPVWAPNVHTAVAPVPWHCRGTAVARTCHGRVTAVSQPCHVVSPTWLFHSREQNRAPLAGPLPPLYRLGPQSVTAVG